jgi:serine/tyrosine/threonine adenylyltransferase
MSTVLQPRAEGVAQGLRGLRFENSFVDELPADKVSENRPRPVRNACYTLVDPTPVAAPRLLAWSDRLGGELGIARPDTVSAEADVLGGNLVLSGMKPYAARYGGHQFGHWAGQLGDGRAITLAEFRDRAGKSQELQLKGAGLTPYSRSADGRAVLRSSVREFLCSEAMHHLGVPTTRALSLVGTGEPVLRDMFYDGHPEEEPGAIVCRVAPSFVRFGNFEILAASEELEELRRLADYVIARHFPELRGDYGAWFGEICRRTAELMAHWMRVGFVHGVMNTDNMSILSLTIDYGPYGWLEPYDLKWTPNTTDLPGRRYCYGNQPNIAHWNLVRLANALHALVGETKPLEQGMETYVETFQSASARMLAAKLGLSSLDRDGDGPLVGEMLELIQKVETDMTIFFRNLARVPLGEGSDEALIEPLSGAFYSEPRAEHRARVAAWLHRYVARVRDDGLSPAERIERMNGANPKYVLRNYLAQLAIDGVANGDASMLERLMSVLEHPYDEQPENEDLAVRRPEWARERPGCSALSCSS